jgi:hypothetical protein
MARIISLFIASPGDVVTERNHVADVAAALNRNMAVERDVRFEVLGWKTDVRARIHLRGPQGPIDEDLPVEKWDVVVGIFWRRFGTPMPEMDGETGTEYEIRAAIGLGSRPGPRYLGRWSRQETAMPRKSVPAAAVHDMPDPRLH